MGGSGSPRRRSVRGRMGAAGARRRLCSQRRVDSARRTCRVGWKRYGSGPSWRSDHVVRAVGLAPKIGERAARLGQKIALQEITSQRHERVELFLAFDAFGNESDVEIAAHCSDGTDELGFGARLMNVAD